MELKRYVVQAPGSAVPLPGALCTLRELGTATPVQAYALDGSALPASFPASSTGEVLFRAANGRYDLHVAHGGREFLFRELQFLDYIEALAAIDDGVGAVTDAVLACSDSVSAAAAAAAAAQAYSRPAVIVVDADRTIGAAEEGKYLRTVGTRILPIASQAAAEWPLHAQLHFRVSGAGTVTLVAPAGGVLEPPAGGTLIMTERMSVTLIRVAEDVWDVIGQTVPAA